MTSSQSAASRPPSRPAILDDSAAKLFRAAIEAASQLGSSKCSAAIDVRRPADAPSALATGACSYLRNSDGRFRSEVELLTAAGVSAGKITLIRDAGHYDLDLQPAGEERRILRAPIGGLYWLEWSGAQGIQGALPPKDLLEELDKAVDWDSAGEGLLDGKPCLEIRGRTKPRTLPPVSLALPGPSTCKIFLAKDSRELLATELVDLHGNFKIVQRYQSVRVKEPFPDATFRIADAAKVGIQEVPEPDWKLPGHVGPAKGDPAKGGPAKGEGTASRRDGAESNPAASKPKNQ